MAYDIERLESALIKADEAGDTESAKTFAAEIRRLRAEQTPTEKSQGSISKRAGELGTGVNQGLASFFGLPVDTAQNLINLAKAGYGTATAAIGRPDMSPNINTKEEPFLGSKYLERKLSDFGFLPNPDPKDVTGRTLQTVGRYVGSSVAPIAGTAKKAADIPSGVASAIASGLGGSTARETLPGNTTAEMLGSLLAPALMYGAAAGTRGLLRGGENSRKEMASTIEAFNKAGVSPTAGQSSPAGFAHPAESLLGRSPGSIRIISSEAMKTQEQLGKTAQGIASQKSTNIEPSQAGRSIQSGVEDFVNRFKQKWNKYDNNLSRHFGPDESIPAVKTKTAAEELNKVIKGAENVSGELTTSKVSAISQNLLKDIGETGALPYQAMRELRSVIGSKIADAGLTPDVSKGQWKLLYSSLSEDLKSAARAKGPQAITDFNRSNHYYKSGLDRIDNLLTRYGKTNTPEQAYSYAMQGSGQGATKLHALRKSLSNDQFKDVVATTVNNLGKALPGKQNEFGDAFSSERFLTNYMTMHPRSKDALFGTGSYRSDLDNLARVSSKIRESGSIYANPSGTGLASGTIGASGVAIGAALSGNLAVPAGILGWMATNNIAARALVNNPKFVKWLSGTTHVNTKQVPSYLARLNSIIQSETDKDSKDAMLKLRESISGE